MTDRAPAPREETRVIWSSSWVRARSAGLFQPLVPCGSFVEKGQLVGNITDPFAEFREQVISSATGHVIGLNNNPVINAGDALLHIGVDNYCKIDKGEAGGD